MSEQTMSALTDYCRVEPPAVRNTSNLTDTTIAVPYEVAYYLRRSGYIIPKDIVRLARIFYHGLQISPDERYDRSADTYASPDKLAEIMDELGFIRHDLTSNTINLWWMYYTILNAPRDWFNQVYDTQPNLTDDFVRAVARSIHENDEMCDSLGVPISTRGIQDFEQFFGLHYSVESATYLDLPNAKPTTKRYYGRSGDAISRVLPFYMGLGDNPARVDRLVEELEHELERRCQPSNRNWRQKLLQITEMRFGPDFEIMQRALVTPIDILRLDPGDYQLLWDAGIHTIGDVLINRDRLVNELFVPEPGYGPNRVLLSSLRNMLERLGYPSFELPLMTIDQK